MSRQRGHYARFRGVEGFEHAIARHAGVGSGATHWCSGRSAAAGAVLGGIVGVALHTAGRPVGPGDRRVRWHSGIGNDWLLRRRVAGRVAAPLRELAAPGRGRPMQGFPEQGFPERRFRAEGLLERVLPVPGRRGRGRRRRRSPPCCSVPRASSGLATRRPGRGSARWWPIGALTSLIWPQLRSEAR
jgi:hypothetical protein